MIEVPAGGLRPNTLSMMNSVFRPWDQHIRIDIEVTAKEFLPAYNVLNRNPEIRS
jgi:hypothetical protein